MEASVQGVELAFEGLLAVLGDRLDTWPRATEPQSARRLEYLLLAVSPEQPQRFDGHGEMLGAAVFEILEMTAILDLALVPEDPVRGSLLGRQVFVFRNGEEVHERVPDEVRFGFDLSLSELAARHGITLDRPTQLLDELGLLTHKSSLPPGSGDSREFRRIAASVARPSHTPVVASSKGTPELISSSPR